MTADAYREFRCDLCGAAGSVEVPHSREFHQGQPIDICCTCGFVYVKQRRDARRIAEVWSRDIFGHAYTAAIPAVRARLVYVAEFLEDAIGPLRDRPVCEIGAGEGHGLELLREPRYGAAVFGVEPSRHNCEHLARSGIDSFCGTIEDYVDTGETSRHRFDAVVIQWTLENCQDCRAMLEGAYQVLRPDGAIAVATGSRILVPFKKPLHTYFSHLPADTHAFRFSANTLQALLALSGFRVTHVNRYLDHDVLCVVARKTDRSEPLDWRGDNYLDVYTFFERWYVDTAMFFPAERP
jgi:2-polyprenyl-3-methyl-5-hydroxy-6-metoxy-1,4-benzoquinol methylase